MEADDVAQVFAEQLGIDASTVTETDDLTLAVLEEALGAKAKVIGEDNESIAVNEMRNIIRDYTQTNSNSPTSSSTTYSSALLYESDNANRRWIVNQLNNEESGF